MPLLLLWLLSRTHCSSLFEGIGAGADANVWVWGLVGCLCCGAEEAEGGGGEYGMRKGSAPVGEAWLLDGSTRKSTPASLRKVCAVRRSRMIPA